MNAPSAKTPQYGAFLAYVFILLFIVTSSAMAALLGVSPGLPMVNTSQNGTTSFNADSGIYHVQTTPLAIQGINGGGFYTITNGTLNYSLVVDSAGNVVGGVPGDDFILTGDIDIDGDGVPDFSGTLLTGEIAAFGFLNATTGSTDLFDFIYTSVGGSLAPEYAGSDIAVTNTSENSTFNGTFDENFGGLAKTVVGTTPPAPASLGDYVWEDLNGNGIQNNGEPGIDNVPVSLTDCQGNQARDFDGDPVSSPILTANGGLYEFTNLRPYVDYCVEFTPPAGYEFTEQNALGSTPDNDSNPDPVTGITPPVNLDSGEYDPTIDAGLYRPGALGNYLWEDLDRDGIQNEPADAGINGQNVFLLDCDLNNPNNPLDTTTTADLNGNPLNPGYYLFKDLVPGCYVVEFTKPDGTVFTEKNAPGSNAGNDSDADKGTGQTNPIDLQSGQTDLTWDAGVYEPVEPELGDFVWEDLNGNGRQDPNEPGIENVTVNLKDCGGNFLTSMTTGADGKYLFTSPDVMVNGCYVVEFVEPDHYCADSKFTMFQTPGVDPALNSDAPTSDPVNLTPPNLVDLTIDAGVVCPAALGDYLWEDRNQDGIQNEPADAGINGQEVFLLDCAGDTQDTTTTANLNGNPGYYLFDNLLPGCYVVEFTKPVDFVFTEKNALGSTPADGSDADQGTGRTDPIELESGETDLTWDAGVLLPIEPELGDFVWEDKNGNGRQDPNEPGIEGATVNLYDCSDKFIASMTTGADGKYLFTSADVMVNGCYVVEFVEPDDYCADSKFTLFQAPGVDPALNSDAPTSDPVNLTPPNLVDLTIDAGVVCPAALGDYLWEDLDHDGFQNEPASAGLNGVPVDLLDPGPDGLCNTGDESVIGSTLTANDGSGNPGYYLFAPLDLGSYCVEVTKPDGFECTKPNEGPNQPSPVDSDVIPTGSSSTVCQTKDPVEDPIDLQSGEFDDTWDAGLYQPASLGDYVWNDVNANGIQDDGNTGLNGVTVRLLSCNDVELKTTVTAAGGPNDQSDDQNGFYEFTDLAPGCYKVSFDTPAGFTVSPRQQGNVALDSDGLVSDPVTLASGDRDATIDSGFYEPRASLGDYVWNDVNANGTQDDGNTGLNGVTVRLLSCNDVELKTTVTAAGGPNDQSDDQNGFYEFTDLAPGCYKVSFDTPAGFTVSPRQQGNVALDSDGLVSDPVTLASGDRDATIDSGFYQSSGPPVCSECDGKVTELTLQYNGTEAAVIRVDQKKDGTVFEQTVQPNGQFTFSGTDKKGTLGTEISIYVDGVLNAKIHTSCSKPIGPGLIAGDFEVIEGYSLNGGLLCPIPPPPPQDCGCDGKVTELTLEYRGDVEAFVEVFQKDGTSVFSGMVQTNGQFSFSGTDKKGTLGTEISIYVNGVLNTTIHTSCSKPIGPGLVAGDFLVIDGSSRNIPELCPVDQPPQPPVGGDCGCDGKVTELTLEYEGDVVAFVEVLQKDGTSVFSGMVQPNGQFSFSGTDKKGTLGTEISIYVGDALNTTIHTSCSDPIGPGLVAGDFLVVDGSSRNIPELCPVDQPPQPPVGGDCGCDGKVTELTLEYEGDVVAFVEVLQKDGTSVFSGMVQPNGQFSFSGTDKKGTLGTEISIYVDDVLNTTIHTSCSNPIGPGLVAGDFEVIDGSSRNIPELCPIN